jgi:serine/threonine protein kinase
VGEESAETNFDLGDLARPGHILLGKYRIERVLGAGGMGAVVLATHLQLEERVAIKFLLSSVSRQPDMVERFGNAIARGRYARQVQWPARRAAASMVLTFGPSASRNESSSSSSMIASPKPAAISIAIDRIRKN